MFVAACVWAGALSPLCCRDGGVVGGRSEAGASGPTARQPPLPRSDVQFMETAPRPSGDVLVPLMGLPVIYLRTACSSTSRFSLT